MCTSVYTDLAQHRCEISSGFVCVCMHRFIESNWFVWITQMNHIPMHIDYDKNVDWFSTQVRPSFQRPVSSKVRVHSSGYVMSKITEVMGTERGKHEQLVLTV